MLLERAKYTPANIRTMFIEEADSVWKNYTPTPEDVSVRIVPDDRRPGVTMSIRSGHRDRRRKAFHRTLQRRTPIPITLYVTEQALAYEEKDFRALLRHEAIHIGYPNHDSAFKRVAREVDAPISTYQLLGGVTTYKLQVQKNRGERFHTVAEYDDKQTAERAIEAYWRVNRGRISKARIRYQE